MQAVARVCAALARPIAASYRQALVMQKGEQDLAGEGTKPYSSSGVNVPLVSVLHCRESKPMYCGFNGELLH